MDAISRAVTAPGPGKELPGNRCVQQAFESLEGKFEEQNGGFGAAPKFPQPCTWARCGLHT